MEPAEAPLKINWVVYTSVSEVKYDGGWWVHFEGSWESLFFGDGNKPFNVGDQIKITFEKAQAHANPRQASVE